MGDIMKLTKNIEEANLITHSGNFHADDIFATVFMSKIIKNPVYAEKGCSLAIFRFICI